MSNLAFLLLAVVVSVVGVMVLWLRNRPATSRTSSIDEFSEKMRALAPDDDGQPPTSSRRRGA
ncbi:MAG: hypothetical protein ACOYOP_09390 [Microthrixaceae bacterium]